MEAAAAATRMPVMATDEALINQARTGDYAGFERLYELYRDTVYRFAYQMTHSRDEAEDITQETFVRAFENLHRFRKEAKFTTWILRIATNLCTDRARMHTRRTALEEQEAGGGLDWMTVGSFANPVEELEQERRAGLVRKAVNALPAHHRTVLILRDFEERNYEEIAAILNCTVGGAKLRVLRARRALRDRLVPLLRDSEPKK
jgi:RNA polymerase sigma-70 factor (ECF subfamily)